MYYFFLLSFTVLGAGIKYIDDAFDEKTFNKTTAVVLAPILGVLGAYTMLIDAVSATILLAIVAGVLLKGKIDNYAHLLGFCIAFFMIITAGVQLLIIPLIVLSIAALLDEVGNDMIDRKRAYFNTNRLSHRFVVYFFDQRWIMKVVILVIALAGVIPLYFFLAMLLFDYAYVVVRLYSQSRQGMPSSKPLPKIYKLKNYLHPERRIKINKAIKLKNESIAVYEARFFSS